MGVRATSIEAYYSMLENGDIGRQEFEVIRFLHGKSFMSRNQIEQYTGIRINAVSGRVNELVKRGLVEEAPEKSPCPITGRNVMKVRLKELV